MKLKVGVKDVVVVVFPMVSVFFEFLDLFLLFFDDVFFFECIKGVHWSSPPLRCEEVGVGNVWR